MQWSKCVDALFAFVLLIGAGAGPAAAQDAAPPAAPDPLITLNEAFRAEYKDALADALARGGPVIVAQEDELIFLHNGFREQATIRPPIYHELKAVAHIPLALYVTLAFETGSVAGPRLAHLEHYHSLLLRARASLPQRRFTREQLERQQHIVSESVDLLEQVIATRSVSREGLARFASSVTPLLWANVNEATDSEMTLLYAQMAKWRNQMTPEEWRHFHVVVVGAHMPRQQHLLYQYFARLLDQGQEGQRLVYAEAQWQEQQALNLLARHILDAAVGEAFFGDPMRMHRDLLADAAKAYLDAHPIDR